MTGRWDWLWVVAFAVLTGYNVAAGETLNAALAAFMGGLWLSTLLLEQKRTSKLADAWDEGYVAGHEDARSVQPSYPDQTANPYRTKEEL